MVNLTNEQRVFIVKKWLETKSYVAVSNEFAATSPGR